MKEVLGKQSKETRCYIMAAVMVFEGFKQLDAMSEIRAEMLLDALSLTKEDMEKFPISEYHQIVAHLSPISDPEVRHWVITNTYSPVLKSRKPEALNAFRNFCSDLKWDANEIKETTDLSEELEGIRPVDCGVRRPIDNETRTASYNTNNSSNSGCLSVAVLLIVSTALFAFALM